MIFDRDQLNEETDLNSILSSIALFEDLTDENIAVIAENVTRQTVERDELLMRKGDPADSFFVVTRGRFEVSNVNTVFAEVSSGELIGEIAFFAGSQRIANVKATRSGEVIRFDKETYDKLTAQMPDLPQAIIASLARRVANTLNKSAKSKASKAGRIVALMANRDGAMPDNVIEKIGEYVTAKGDWDLVMSNETNLDMSCVSNTDLSRWLEERDGAAANTLLLCRNPISNNCWAEAVSENSDQIFLVGENHLADSGPVKLSAFEKTIFATRENRDLQLLLWREDKADRTRLTKNWLKDRHVKLHHQVALNSTADLGRIAGFIQGKAHDIIF
ncbi:MAG: cyclic nucleotide-binding domain-containing protein [Hyphomicrobiales bacterium]